MKFINSNLEDKIINFCKSETKITFLTGAGISADSGIPTFRDVDGYWSVGSVNYTPQELGTYDMFIRKPLEVWKWFMYRKDICNKAKPNISHLIISDFEKLFKNRFSLISQNIDGLHKIAGNTEERYLFIHGDLEYSRCGFNCSNELYPFPNFKFDRNYEFTEQQISKLKCKKCNLFLRPHVLWFDEFYEERLFKSDSAIKTSKETEILFIIGTSGSTTLPVMIFENVIKNQGIIVDINTKENYFSKRLKNYNNGYSVIGKSSKILPEFFDIFKKHYKQ
ncbi:MAG: NAD-dependent deacetylase [Bacteroidales bacterium]|nr:NAD-dependent deacetylase [Bacteroidales bacterium]